MKYVNKVFFLTIKNPCNTFSMSTAEHVSRVRRLYKLIFRVHRALPPELRLMGNNYARDEFKRHKDCQPDEARIFLNEWTDYAINLARQMKPVNQTKKGSSVGMPLDPKLLDHMSDEQIVQLYELHKAAASSLSRPMHHEVEIMESQFNERGAEVVSHSFKRDDQTKKAQDMPSTSKEKKEPLKIIGFKGLRGSNANEGYMETQFNGKANDEGSKKK